MMNPTQAKNLNRYYEGQMEILATKKDFLLIAWFEGGENFEFTIYKTDKTTGMRAGYIGSPVIKLHKQDTDSATAQKLAHAAFNAL